MESADKKIIWIASYPKSGNTWVRSFLSSYYCTLDGSFNFDLLKNIPTFESDLFLPFLSKEEAAKKPHIMSEYWLEVQKNSKLKNGDFIFLKTHNFCGEINNRPFTSAKYTMAQIYIVRDPREVVISYSNHFSKSLDESVDIISSSTPSILLNKGINYPVYIYNWGVNYLSWKNFNTVPRILIKYEDLKSEPYKTFKNLINFLNNLGLPSIEKKKFKQSVQNTSFTNLKKLEKNIGFKEQHLLNNINFFNSGSTNSWKNKLSKSQIDTIEKKFKLEMQELEYI